MIDWGKTQRNIGAGVDGNPGRETYGRLMGKAVGHSYDDTMRRLGESAVKHFPLYGVDQSAALIAGFIAETGHETGGYRRWEENLSYSAQGLANTWPSRFATNPKSKGAKTPNALALRIARRPQDIARETYGLRMGNESGANDNDANEDGWQFRGRGPTMLTGKDNYIEAAGLVGIDLLHHPELAADPFTGLLIACGFYKKNGVFRLMAANDNEGERRAVNGGLIGFKEVQEIRRDVNKLLVAA
jgi:putative chitinase